MISFVWSPGESLPAGTGGSENYTVGQVRELNRRGVAAQVVTIGVGETDGREGFPGIPFRSLESVSDVARLPGTVVFTTFFPEVSTLEPAFQMLHIPPPVLERDRVAVARQIADRRLIATSRFAAGLWAEFARVHPSAVDVVYPFAEPQFGRQPRTAPLRDTVRILYAGRLTPEKGIFTLLAMLHNELLGDVVGEGTRLTFTVTTAGADKPQGGIIQRMLEVHPGIRLVPSRKTAESMAALMAAHDIVVMPSNSQYWHETFGIVSVEAQHAGCRVVASDDGGLPETDCGASILVEPDNAAALAVGIGEALALGPVSAGARSAASENFTVRQSVDHLLAVLRQEPSVMLPAGGLERPALVRSASGNSRGLKHSRAAAGNTFRSRRLRGRSGLSPSGR